MILPAGLLAIAEDLASRITNDESYADERPACWLGTGKAHLKENDFNAAPKVLGLACLQKAPSRRPQNAVEPSLMAYNCGSCKGWNAEAAEVWWPRYLPGLAGPLTATTGKRQTTAVVM
jgi:hypothetical protein